MNRKSLVAGGVVVTLAGGAMAAPLVFQIDADAMSASASGAFSEGFTGTFKLFNTPADPDTNGNAVILDILVDGTPQTTGGADADEFFFEMNITFDTGRITAGDVTVKVDETGSVNTYSADIRPTTGVAIQDVGDAGFTYNIAGLTFDGMFADDDGTFLGVDISPWGSAQPVPGFFSTITFEPNASHEDADVDSDVFVMIPLPSGAALAGLGLSGIVVRRRR